MVSNLGANGSDDSRNSGVVLKFVNLKAMVGDREILVNVSGLVKPGEVLAVMGSSGSGKTTLINFLAGHKVGDRQSGDILLNGQRLNKRLRRKICYVRQEDIFFDNLTLKETLTYSALLRLPEKMPKKMKLEKVDEIIKTLDLEKCVDTNMGSVTDRGLSGGEKKRANIGCELITDPSLIFLDEPTSGLDSSTAYNLIKTLDALAEHKSKTIVMTIHQPSSQIFYLFDKLLLLAHGKVAYYGKASKVLDFFESAGFVCEQHFNPADFVLEALSGGPEQQEKIVLAFKKWAKRTSLNIEPENANVLPEQNDLKPTTSETSNNLQVLPTNPNKAFDNAAFELDVVVDSKTKTSEDSGEGEHNVGSETQKKWNTSFWTQLHILARRNFKQSLPVILSKLNFVQNLLLALIVGFIWFQLPHKEETIDDRNGALFFFVMYLSAAPMFQAVFVFPAEDEIIMKERSTGYYRLSAYFIGKSLSESPLIICYPVMFLIVIYWIIGFNSSVAFFGQLLNLIVTSITSQSLGLAVGATTMSFNEGIVVGTVLLIAMILVGGFFNQNIPTWLSWLKPLSFIAYAYENAVLMEFTNIKSHSCADEKTVYEVCLNNGTSVTGDMILNELGIEGSFGANIGILFAFTVVFRAIAYGALRFLHSPK